MAQQTTVYQRSTPELAVKATHLDVAVAELGDTTILQIQTGGMIRLFVSFSVADNNLDAFKIYGKANSDAPNSLLYSAGADYTSPTGILVGTSGDLTAQGAGTSGWFIIDVRGISEIVLKTSSASGIASVSVYAGGS